MKCLYNLGLIALWFLATPANAQVIYTNGTLSNGQNLGENITDNSVSDSFTSPSSVSLTSATAGLWSGPPQVPVGISWSIGSTPFGADINSGTSNLTNTHSNLRIPASSTYI